jgi:hypothetical protein
MATHAPVEDEVASEAETLAAEETTALLPDFIHDEPKHLYRQNALILSFVCIFVLEVSYGAMVPSINAVMESIICRDYYPSILDPLADPLCKSPEVQGKLAMLRGWQTTFDCIPCA